MDDKLKPCPFCGGVAQRVDIPGDEHDPNAGGSYIACQFCLASSSIAFGDKSSLVDNWNNRAGDARIRAEALAEAGKAAYNHAEVFQRRLASAQEALLKYPSIVTKLVRGYGIDVNEKQITIWLERELAAILADEPKEEREAEVGDLVWWVSHREAHVARADRELIEAFAEVSRDAGPIVLMRRAEVEAIISRVGI